VGSRGVFAISVAADLVGTRVQNLRVYERHGLLTPQRTAGGTRVYSTDDVARLRRIVELLAEGLNLVGIATVLTLEDDNVRLRRELATYRSAGENSATASAGDSPEGERSRTA